ncbi:MAG: MBL fold metallo-hydrolase [Gammaproteobacteria bacterium]|jgi:glyoxylase-like metal-dependent hydrolase (beta-lactamase superfamily II)
MKRHAFLSAICVALLSGNVSAQDFTDAKIETQQLGDGLYVLFGVGGNILASIGDDGVFVVDAQFPEMAPMVAETIERLGGGTVDFVVNTHWHFDHADGNKVFGPNGAKIAAHDNSRRMLMQDNVINLVSRTVDQPRYEHAALPVLTYGSTMSFHLNGGQIDLLHFGPAHTMGDSAVVFRNRDVVHMGDVFNNAGYPFIDADNGGSLNGIIEFCSAVLEKLPRTAIVVPGHGAVSDYQGLENYIAMLSEIRDRLSALMSSGATLEQVQAADITADWDAGKGDPTMLLDRAFASMSN